MIAVCFLSNAPRIYDFFYAAFTLVYTVTLVPTIQDGVFFNSSIAPYNLYIRVDIGLLIWALMPHKKFLKHLFQMNIFSRYVFKTNKTRHNHSNK